MSGLAIIPVLVKFESSIHYLTGSQYQCDLFNTSSNPPAVVFSCCYYAGPVIIGDPLALFCISIPRVQYTYTTRPSGSLKLLCRNFNATASGQQVASVIECSKYEQTVYSKFEIEMCSTELRGHPFGVR